MAPTKCAYFMCNNTSDQKPMFRFPSADPTRLQVWLSNCGNMTITHLSQNELRNRYLCLEHFDEKFVQNQGGRRTRITKKALPKHYKEEENMAISPHSPIPSTSEDDDNFWLTSAEVQQQNTTINSIDSGVKCWPIDVDSGTFPCPAYSSCFARNWGRAR
ncbi:hypothetical protein MSG28_006993 [Choristoneura fumiferana]|uniref:Uncharacterized protein n=1 Tax=Choristoneura fumiferana TaxID=7141 RepID=A0ACC0JM07_CHOFU|nr:hypothetical protein MSG28_006993 [Choristoneura fumiferana]